MKALTTRLLSVMYLVLILCHQQGWGQTSEDWDWVSKHYAALLNELLPIQNPSGAFVGFRSHQDLYTRILEYSFVFEKDYATQQIDVVVRIPESTSLYDQIMLLHLSKPGDSIENIKKKLRVIEWRLTTNDCSAIHTLFEQFEKVTFSPPSTDLIILHPLVYEFKMSTIAGSMNLTLVERDNRLVDWAINARDDLDKCVRDKHSKSR